VRRHRTGGLHPNTTLLFARLFDAEHQSNHCTSQTEHANVLSNANTHVCNKTSIVSANVILSLSTSPRPMITTSLSPTNEAGPWHAIKDASLHQFTKADMKDKNEHANTYNNAVGGLNTRRFQSYGAPHVRTYYHQRVPMGMAIRSTRQHNNVTGFSSSMNSSPDIIPGGNEFVVLPYRFA
jgi:hypothetical protein